MSEESGAAPEAAAVEEVSSGEIQEQSSPESEGYSEGHQAEAQEAAEAIEEAIDNGASEEEVQDLVRKFKLKVDGQEIEREVDLSDEDYIRNQLQLAEVSKRRMQESAELRKEFEDIIGEMRNNPMAFMQQLGLDPDELAETHLRGVVDQRKKTPEQIQAEQIQAELQQARLEAQRLREEKAQAEFEQIRQQEAQTIKEDMDKALSAHKTLPKTPHVQKRIAEAMLWAVENGYDDVKVSDVLPSVENELRKEFNQMMDDLPDELIEKFLGKRTMDRLRNKRMSQMKKSQPVSAIKETSRTKSEDDKPKQRIKAKDFFRNL